MPGRDWCGAETKYQTTYSNMNEWYGRKGIPSNVPVTVTDANWRENMGGSNNRTGEFYRRFEQLQSNMAYRFPEPGPPRERQGRIGGSWRHIKEVLGHGGSRVVFVDGLVSLYDTERKTSGADSRLPATYSGIGRRKSPLWAPTSISAQAPPAANLEYERLDMPSNTTAYYQPRSEVPQLPNVSQSAQGAKYKGFYALRRENTHY